MISVCYSLFFWDRLNMKEEKRVVYLTDITESRGIRGSVVKRETRMFARELIGMVDCTVTVIAESCFVGGTEERGFYTVAHITKYLHLSQCLSREVRKRYYGFLIWKWKVKREWRQKNYGHLLGFRVHTEQLDFFHYYSPFLTPSKLCTNPYPCLCFLPFHSFFKWFNWHSSNRLLIMVRLFILV